jgi:hypothetical protein
MGTEPPERLQDSRLHAVSTLVGALVWSDSLDIGRPVISVRPYNIRQFPQCVIGFYRMELPQGI